MLAGVEVPIVIVGFGNAADIVKCLTAIATQRGCPKIGVFICENGGADAFDALIGAISTPGGPCAGDGEKLGSGRARFRARAPAEARRRASSDYRCSGA